MVKITYRCKYMEAFITDFTTNVEGLDAPDKHKAFEIQVWGRKCVDGFFSRTEKYIHIPW